MRYDNDKMTTWWIRPKWSAHKFFYELLLQAYSFIRSAFKLSIHLFIHSWKTNSFKPIHKIGGKEHFRL